MLPKFIITAIMTSCIVAGGSLVWPLVTDRPMPQPLSVIRQFIVQTPAGDQAARVLGVEDSDSVEKIDIASVITSTASSAVHVLGEKIEKFVAQEISKQINRQFQSLPDTQKQRISETLCVPISPTEAVRSSAQATGTPDVLQ